MNDILLIEDHKELAELIQAFLYKEGFSSYHAESAEEGLLWHQQHQARIILLDIMLPGMDGFAFCQKIRTVSDVPILMLSAKSDKADQLLGFELGADDYIRKPVDPDILCAKIHALLHRHGKVKKNIIQSGALLMNIDARKVSKDGVLLELNVKEFELLMLFVANPGKTLHKEFLFNQVWGSECDSENQTLTVHIKMLRAKIEDRAKEAKRIQTVWGIGYRYEEI